MYIINNNTKFKKYIKEIHNNLQKHKYMHINN